MLGATDAVREPLADARPETLGRRAAPAASCFLASQRPLPTALKGLLVLPIFTDFSDFLGRLRPSTTTSDRVITATVCTTTCFSRFDSSSNVAVDLLMVFDSPAQTLQLISFKSYPVVIINWVHYPEPTWERPLGMSTLDPRIPHLDDRILWGSGISGTCSLPLLCLTPTSTLPLPYLYPTSYLPLPLLLPLPTDC